MLLNATKALLRLFQKEKVESGKQKGTEDFWALKDINFEIKHGDTIGHAAFSVRNTPIMNIDSSLGAKSTGPTGVWMWASGKS